MLSSNDISIMHPVLPTKLNKIKLSQVQITVTVYNYEERVSQLWSVLEIVQGDYNLK